MGQGNDRSARVMATFSEQGEKDLQSSGLRTTTETRRDTSCLDSPQWRAHRQPQVVPERQYYTKIDNVEGKLLGDHVGPIVRSLRPTASSDALSEFFASQDSWLGRIVMNWASLASTRD